MEGQARWLSYLVCWVGRSGNGARRARAASGSRSAQGSAARSPSATQHQILESLLTEFRGMRDDQTGMMNRLSALEQSTPRAAPLVGRAAAAPGIGRLATPAAPASARAPQAGPPGLAPAGLLGRGGPSVLQAAPGATASSAAYQGALGEARRLLQVAPGAPAVPLGQPVTGATAAGRWSGQAAGSAGAGCKGAFRRTPGRAADAQMAAAVHQAPPDVARDEFLLATLQTLAELR